MRLEEACDYRSVRMLEEAVAAADGHEALMARNFFGVLQCGECDGSES